MSFKSKNLHYESNEPAFLRKLRGQVATGDVDRHERPIARPKRLKGDDEEDDGPTYVLEDSHDTLSKDEYAALVAGKSDDGPDEKLQNGALSGDEEPNGEEKEENKAGTSAKQNVTEVGGVQKKRKAAKVIDDGEDKEEEVKPKLSQAKKAKKKAKAVKLSFGDDDGT